MLLYLCPLSLLKDIIDLVVYRKNQETAEVLPTEFDYKSIKACLKVQVASLLQTPALFLEAMAIPEHVLSGWLFMCSPQSATFFLCK